MEIIQWWNAQSTSQYTKTNQKKKEYPVFSSIESPHKNMCIHICN